MVKDTNNFSTQTSYYTKDSFNHMTENKGYKYGYR